MGFTPSLRKKGMTDAVILGCMLQGGPPSLHYYCAVVLHSCIVLPPVGHSSNHEYRYCQLTRQSTCVSKFIALLRFSFDSSSYFCVYPTNIWSPDIAICRYAHNSSNWHSRITSRLDYGHTLCPKRCVHRYNASPYIFVNT